MKKIKKEVIERIPVILIVLVLILYTALMIIICGIGFSNRYEDDIARLEIENKKLAYDLKQKKKDNKHMSNSIEDLQAQVDGKKAIECDCAWYEDFYYEHAEEFGVYE